MSRDAMGRVVPEPSAQKEPGAVLGAFGASKVVQLRDGIYAALQSAVDAFGGQLALAEALGASVSDTHNRVMRKDDSKGNLQRAFLDFLAPLFDDQRSALVLMSKLSELAGFEPPVARRRVNAEDIGNAWLRMLETLPPGERSGRRADMAAALGVRAEDLK